MIFLVVFSILAIKYKIEIHSTIYFLKGVSYLEDLKIYIQVQYIS